MLRHYDFVSRPADLLKGHPVCYLLLAAELHLWRYGGNDAFSYHRSARHKECRPCCISCHDRLRCCICRNFFCRKSRIPFYNFHTFWYYCGSRYRACPSSPQTEQRLKAAQFSFSPSARAGKPNGNSARGDTVYEMETSHATSSDGAAAASPGTSRARPLSPAEFLLL